MRHVTLFSLAVVALFAAYIIQISHCYAASVNATANATVIQALSITKTQDLNFGTGARSDAAKVIAPAGATAAIFTVSGQPSTAYTITLPTTINMTRTGGTETLAVNTFTSTPSSTGLIAAGGTQSLRVGATRVAIPAAQAVGSYVGTFTVTVVY